jgi:N-acetylneuraminic acid mutarotase
MPTARGGLSASAVNGKIYVIGGGKDETLSIVEEYNPATNTWTRKADMPTPRGCLSTSVVNGKIYAIGGATTEFVSLSVVEEYNPATDTWEQKTDIPTARYGLSTSVVNGKIYAIGGNTGNPAWVNIPAVEEYDPATDTWMKKADMPTQIVMLSTSVVNGKIYAIGGGLHPNVSLSTVEEYDPATDTWAKRADMPTPRWGLSTSVVNGYIYAIGGTPGGPRPRPTLSTVEVYDAATDTWTKKADMLTARCGLSTSLVNGYIYAIGGAPKDPAVELPHPVCSILEAYDTGFRSSGTNMEGKLPTTWGDMKVSDLTVSDCTSRRLGERKPGGS